MTLHQPAAALSQAHRSFLAGLVVLLCAMGQVSASENEAAVSTIAAAIASDTGGSASQYMNYAEKLAMTLSVLTPSQLETVLDTDPGGLLGTLESDSGESEPEDDDDDDGGLLEDLLDLIFGL
tara:strand:- start:1302 stop:1670 length:369 start_codon:yes stop_codon:yes gene_type:complete